MLTLTPPLILPLEKLKEKRKTVRKNFYDRAFFFVKLGSMLAVLLSLSILMPTRAYAEPKGLTPEQIKKLIENANNETTFYALIGDVRDGTNLKVVVDGIKYEIDPDSLLDALENYLEKKYGKNAARDLRLIAHEKLKDIRKVDEILKECADLGIHAKRPPFYKKVVLLIPLPFFFDSLITTALAGDMTSEELAAELVEDQLPFSYVIAAYTVCPLLAAGSLDALVLTSEELRKKEDEIRENLRPFVPGARVDQILAPIDWQKNFEKLLEDWFKTGAHPDGLRSIQDLEHYGLFNGLVAEDQLEDIWRRVRDRNPQ